MLSRRILGGASGTGGFTPVNLSLLPPIRAAYYFPWYDEEWDQIGYTPFTRYTPSLGAYYDQNDPLILQQHMEWAVYAGLDAFVVIWRGRQDGVGVSYAQFSSGQANGDVKLGVMLDQALQHGLKMCILYEVEAYANPSAAEVEAEFVWLAANHFNHPAYLHVDGRPVIFVYTGADHGDALCAKYSTATAGFTTAYIAIQTVTDPSGASPQPDAWYIFSNARTAATSGSYSICPGYWRIDEVSPVTARNLALWQGNIASMVASGADWQMINSFNEWGEGSQFEPETTHGTDYLDALHNG